MAVAPRPYKQTTSSLKMDVTVVASRASLPIADRVPVQLLLPGQAPPVGGLSYVVCSKGFDEEVATYSRPKPLEPVVLISCSAKAATAKPMKARMGRTDYSDTIALELAQPEPRVVNPQCVVSYHGLLHPQQPLTARIMQTDTLVTRVAGTARVKPTASVKLVHAYCIRTVEFTVGIAQGPHQTWLQPLRDCNAVQHHTVIVDSDVERDPSKITACSGCPDIEWQGGRCVNCTRGQYGHFRLAEGDTIRFGANGIPECLDVTPASLDWHFFEPGFTVQVDPQGRSNRHAQDISTLDQ